MPADMYNVLAAELIIWSMACMAKLNVMNSTTGRKPAMAAPQLIPVNPACIIQPGQPRAGTLSRNCNRLQTLRGSVGSCSGVRQSTHCLLCTVHLCDWCVSDAHCAMLLQKPLGDLHTYSSQQSNSLQRHGKQAHLVGSLVFPNLQVTICISKWTWHSIDSDRLLAYSRPSPLLR